MRPKLQVDIRKIVKITDIICALAGFDKPHTDGILIT